MKLTWILAALLFIAFAIILNLVGPLKGSTSTDFPDNLQPDQNPLPECPDSPNCVRITVELDIEPNVLFDILPRVLEEMNAEEFEQDSQSLQTSAVFRIPLFGFRDDVSILIKAKNSNQSLLHLSSRSRDGHGDLGVNRRRVKTFMSTLNKHLN